MNAADARRLSIGVFLIVAAVVVWESLVKTGKPLPPFRTVVALVVLAAGMSVGVDVAPQVFGPLVLLVGLGIVISRVPPSPGPFRQLYGGQSAPSRQPATPVTPRPPLVGGNVA